MIEIKGEMPAQCVRVQSQPAPRDASSHDWRDRFTVWRSPFLRADRAGGSPFAPPGSTSLTGATNAPPRPGHIEAVRPQGDVV